MSFTFRVVFAGLCAFVPDRPFRTDRPTRVRVLLPNLLLPRRLNGGNGDILSPHLPILEFSPENLRSEASTRRADLYVRTRRVRRENAVCLLRGEDVRFKLAADERLVPDLTEVGEHPTTWQERRSLRWLMEMRNAGESAGFVLPVLVDEEGLDQRVVSRVEIDRGLLYSYELAKGRWRLGPGQAASAAEFTRVTARVALEIEVLSNDVTIELLHREERRTQTLVLGPSDRSPGDVEIMIKNREVEELLELPVPAPRATEDSDFEIYYQLTDDRNGPRLVPQLLANGSGSVNSLHKPCIPSELRVR